MCAIKINRKNFAVSWLAHSRRTTRRRPRYIMVESLSKLALFFRVGGGGGSGSSGKSKSSQSLNFNSNVYQFPERENKPAVIRSPILRHRRWASYHNQRRLLKGIKVYRLCIHNNLLICNTIFSLLVVKKNARFSLLSVCVYKVEELVDTLCR